MSTPPTLLVRFGTLYHFYWVLLLALLGVRVKYVDAKYVDQMSAIYKWQFGPFAFNKLID